MNQLLNSSMPPNQQPLNQQQPQLGQGLQFMKTTQLTPQQAQAQVQDFLKNNSISTEEFNRIGAMATQIQKALNLR